MYHFLQAKVSYLDELTQKQETLQLLCNGFSFSDSEEILTKYLTDFEDILNFEVVSMSRIKFDEFYDTQTDEQNNDLYRFFIVKANIVNEEGKDVKHSFLVRSIMLENATKTVERQLTEENAVFDIKEVKKLDYKELVVGKFCETLGLIVVAYSDQKEVEITNELRVKIECEKEQLRTDLGADEVFGNKFKVLLHEKTATENIAKLMKFKDRVLARRILKTWTETFVDEDTSEIIPIERNEVLVNSGNVLNDEIIELIKPFVGGAVNSLVFYI